MREDEKHVTWSPRSRVTKYPLMWKVTSWYTFSTINNNHLTFL